MPAIVCQITFDIFVVWGGWVYLGTIGDLVCFGDLAALLLGEFLSHLEILIPVNFDIGCIGDIQEGSVLGVLFILVFLLLN